VCYLNARFTASCCPLARVVATQPCYIHHDTATQTTGMEATQSTHMPQAIASDFSSPWPTLAASWVAMVKKFSGNLRCCRPASCTRIDAMHHRMTAAGVVLLCTLLPTPGNCAAAARHEQAANRMRSVSNGLSSYILVSEPAS
jgi:hypothetical protein